ncbi:MAG: 30S ribosomal protein S4e [Candidatus Woesearchaeota archaeon]
MSHLKRLRAPKSWSIKKRKGIKFIARPMPGPHKLNESITLNHVLIEVLNLAKNKKEVRYILNQGKILVNNKSRKGQRFPIGLMDTVAIPDNGSFYIVLYDEHGKFSLVPIKKEDSEVLLCKIINKTILKKKKTQINLHNGENILVEKDGYRVGDTLLVQGDKIKKHLKLEKGSLIYLTSGKYKGSSGVLEKIERLSELSEDMITIKRNKEQIVTRKKYAFVIEKEFKK